MGIIIAVLITVAALVAMFCIGYGVGYDKGKADEQKNNRNPFKEWKRYRDKCLSKGICPLCQEPLDGKECTLCHWGTESNFQ